MLGRKEKMDLVEKSLLGVGSAAILWMLFRSNQAFAAKTHKISANMKPVSEDDQFFFASYTPRVDIKPKLIDVDPKEFANPKARIPAMFMSYDPDKNDMRLKVLNFTPRRMTTPLNQREYSDIGELLEPNKIPTDFMAYHSPAKMIHPNDYQLLQKYNMIPEGFPISRTQYTKSVNGDNEFIVGYSEPYDDKVSSGTTFKTVKPLWAVSFGKNFNSSSNPSKDIIPHLSEFYETALRMLAAEWELSNVGFEGCLPKVGRRLCDLERAALIGIMMRRRQLRAAKRGISVTFEDVAYAKKGQTWNEGHTYRVGFNGYPGSKKSAHANAVNRRQFPKKTKIKERFEDYIKHYLWHMPLLGGIGITHFGHPGTLTRVPKFLRVRAPHASDPKGYTLDKTVSIGGTAVATHGDTFK